MLMTLTPAARVLALATSLVLLGHLAAAATVLPAGFTETPLATGLATPTAMAIAPDGRVFVCEQGGALRVVTNGVLLPAPFVTIPVNASGERGLLGVAFDPDFATNQYVYVYYTATTPTIHNRVSRFVAGGDVAVPGSEQVLMELETLGATNHNGGAIHFGPDGKLYVAVGENANASNSQTLSNRLGKILRINADGSIPSDNPFFSTAAGANRSIWARGLRNPFTFGFQQLTGAMFINDVGQSSWEEINHGIAGANYGWPVTEGASSTPGFTNPVYAYDHGSGCAISGGAFHDLTRSQFPFEYWGAYFFADFCGGWIRYRHSNGTVLEFASGISRPVDLQTAADGSLYYLARGTGATTGIVARISYESSPTVEFSANGTDGPLRLADGTPLNLDIGFAAGDGGPLPAAEVYIGVLGPGGVFWMNQTGAFARSVARVYAGPLPTFGPSPLVRVPDVASMAPGAYLWFILVDGQVDGIPTGDVSDFVVTRVE